jgi:hypothetical protein
MSGCNPITSSRDGTGLGTRMGRILLTRRLFVSESGVNRLFKQSLVVFPDRGKHLSALRRAMKTNHKICLLVGGLLLVGSTHAQEKKIKRSELPAAVEKTVVEQSKGATIRRFSEEKEHGQTTYEVEMVVNGRSKDVEMDASGTVIDIEEQVDLQVISTEVRTGLQAKAGKGQITKVESITKNDNLVAYEAQVVTDGKKSEVQVGADGKPLNHHTFIYSETVRGGPPPQK